MFGTWCIPNSAIPPDVILEVGPQPSCTSYAAHGSLLALHSGYLRAALRTLEPAPTNPTFGSLRGANMQPNPQITASVSMVNSRMALSGANGATTILHLPNVTTEQFTPLLTYMYTGYLDLTLDNIFGVLLATHLLHMPRALELCRSFLSSSSTLSAIGDNSALAAPPRLPDLERTFYVPKSSNATYVPKLVRPIASKALTTVGLHFIAPPTASQINLLPSVPFRSLGPSIISSTNPLNEQPQDVTNENHESPPQSPISVTQYEHDNVTLQTPQLHNIENDDTMDSITVDSKCDDSENEPTLQNEFLIDPQRSAKEDMICKGETLTTSTRKHSSVVPQSTVKRHRSVELATDESRTGNGVIIDIASCDGPVRFRRVLNVMYGCNKNNKSPHSRTTDTVGQSDAGEEVKKIVTQHRSLRYASSFHQQMARNISDIRKLSGAVPSSNDSQSQNQNMQHMQPAASQDLPPDHYQQKDENSQEDNAPYNNEETSTGSTSSTCYTCVYCKHSFKSHYCYQKHAKRHLIPLQLNEVSSVLPLNSLPPCLPTKIHSGNIVNAKIPAGACRRSNSAFTGNNNSSNSSSSSSSSNSSSDGAIKREVKPLDMNVQYYPCKTCGSKFPSYYFVHKHRKLCHAEEDDEPNGQGNNRTTNRVDPASSTNSKLIISVPIGKEDNMNKTSEVQFNNQKTEDHS